MMFLYGFTVGIVGAALRLGLIQHIEGQKIIHRHQTNYQSNHQRIFK